MWGFLRGLLIVVAVLTVFTIGEMVLNAHDEHANAELRAEVISR